MSRYLVVVSRRANSRLISVPISELALTALGRLPNVRSSKVERQSKSEVSLILESDESNPVSDLHIQFGAFGLMLRHSQRLDLPR